MKIYLASPNAITAIPWINNAPDFSGIEDPTLSVLVNAWNTFLSSGQELEIIPDPEPIPEPTIPNWGYFGGAIIQSPLYEKYKSNPDFQILGSMITVFTSNGGDTQMYPAFVLIWNKFNTSSGGLLTEEIAEIAGLLAMFNIPFVINNQGEITQL